MSARAIASQKNKRAGPDLNNKFPSNNPQSTQFRITVPQAIKMLEKKLIEVEKLVVGQNNIPNQADILAKMAKHINDLEKHKNDTSSSIIDITNKSDTIEKSVVEKLNEKDKLFESHITELRNKLTEKDKLIDSHTSQLAELQTIINKLSLKLLNE
tara:strand:+ start:150 stop:617 length:468 start_codon:yes stop_codon:yes gene_type:complete